MILLNPPLSIGGFHISRLFMALAIAAGGIPLAKDSLLALIEEKRFDVDELP